jgi:hypothetical protein
MAIGMELQHGLGVVLADLLKLLRREPQIPGQPQGLLLQVQRRRGTLKDDRRRTERCALQIASEPCGPVLANQGKP